MRQGLQHGFDFGAQVAEAVRVVAALWDDAGHVVAVQTIYVSRPRLVPQEAVSFEVPFYELGGPAVTYTLTVVGQVGRPEAG